MKVVDIIKSVRWCIDEEAVDTVGFANASAYDFDGGIHTDNGLMNNIIKDKIGAAIRWVCLNAHSSLLSVDNLTVAEGVEKVELIKEETIQVVSNNLITPQYQPLRIIRVRGANWHKAITGENIISEDSEEYLELRYGSGAEATLDRPQAALINSKAKKIEVWPVNGAGTITITYAVAPSAADIAALKIDATEVNIPPLVETSLIYYIAFLLLTAYGDSRAEGMLSIAKQNVGSRQE